MKFVYWLLECFYCLNRVFFRREDKRKIITSALVSFMFTGAWFIQALFIFLKSFVSESIPGKELTVVTCVCYIIFAMVLGLRQNTRIKLEYMDELTTAERKRRAFFGFLYTVFSLVLGIIIAEIIKGMKIGVIN